MSFACYLEWQAVQEIPASQPERDSSGDEFDDASTLMLGSPSPERDLRNSDSEDDDRVPPLEDAKGNEVADTMMDEDMDGEELSDSDSITYGIYSRQATSGEPDAEPSALGTSPATGFESDPESEVSPITPKGKSLGWREELFTTPRYGNSGPTRPEMVEMCLALMEFFKENYPDILKSLSFQHSTYFCFSYFEFTKGPKNVGKKTNAK